jgi:hypothetical protein
MATGVVLENAARDVWQSVGAPEQNVTITLRMHEMNAYKKSYRGEKSLGVRVTLRDVKRR